ncbi:MAG: ribosome silencing factor [Defluviitaleaceae bacterium]|nr:ribosome silencing factor [Defluviitaleaceae bacterium]
MIKELQAVLEDKFATEVVVMDISKISILGDYFVIATGKNENQIQAMGEAAEEYLAKNGIPLKHKEGGYNTGWALLDFGVIIMHLFDEESRSFYNLERLWSDGEPV